MWRRLFPKRPEPRLSDADFNDKIDDLLHQTRDILAKPCDDYCPMFWEIRDENINLGALFVNDGSAIDGWDAFTTDFGRRLAAKRRTAPQAIFFGFLATSPDGRLHISIHGATPDGRANASALAVTRNEQRNLQAGDEVTLHYPADPSELPDPNYAVRILNGFRRL